MPRNALHKGRGGMHDTDKQGPPKYAFFRASIMLFSRWSYAFYAFKATKLCFFCFHNLRAVLTKILDFLKKIELNSLIR